MVECPEIGLVLVKNDHGLFEIFGLKRTNLLKHRFESFINFNFRFFISLNRFEFWARFELFKPLISASINHFLYVRFKIYSKKHFFKDFKII